ncbi:Alpha/beta hydrolase family protein [Nannocystis exedens]|uniref:Alpha/beta hydrolase family protein n=1 Tax=Nannocystis exedens TaxID=54 RepID=A0A1I1W3L5_9BACT|nr:alpha/beta fold hydrolase [Nannocystis exedens]PCC72930.1 PGAP1-like protein [Nannocystis exedens]SFD87560.1 Alpha/beta hydrolase family protein [Nannocystis exedens]
MLSLDPLGPDDLGESRERARLAAHAGCGVLAPYGPPRASLRPLVLVHGIHGHPGELRALAERALAAGDVQPYLFLYDDLGRYLDRSGDDLARALAQLACQAPRPAVVIVAHSMGGIVARCALNSLVDPRWFPRFTHRQLRRGKVRVRGSAEAVRAGVRLEAPCAADFAAIDVLAVDTPWSGFCAPRLDLRNLWRRQRAWVDMVSNSVVLTRLHGVALPAHFRVHHLEADQRGAGLPDDKICTLGDLDDADLVRFQRAILGDRRALGSDPRFHNLFAALAGERSFPALAADLRASGLLSASAFRAELRRAVPRLAGSHTSVLENTALFALLDELLVRGATEVRPQA